MQLVNRKTPLTHQDETKHVHDPKLQKYAIHLWHPSDEPPLDPLVNDRA